MTGVPEFWLLGMIWATHWTIRYAMALALLGIQFITIIES